MGIERKDCVVFDRIDQSPINLCAIAPVHLTRLWGPNFFVIVRGTHREEFLTLTNEKCSLGIQGKGAITVPFSMSPMPSRHSILLVDDDPDLLNLYRMILDSDGYQVVGVGSRALALAEVAAKPFDVILLDCSMAGVSNEEFRAAVANASHGRVVPPIVGFSAYPEASNEARKMRALFGRFIEKPLDVDSVLSAVRRLCATLPPSMPAQQASTASSSSASY